MASKHKADEKVQVTVRCRPMNESERRRRVKKVVDCNSKNREVTVANSVASMGLSTMHQTKSYSFDRVFGPNASQLDVYKSVIESQLQDVLAGYNCTVLAYGQTGTGKTYTMEGERSPDDNFTWDTDPKAGIIPRALSQLFDCLERAGSDFSVRVSLLEIYNEEIYDLLSSSNDMLKMKIYEDNCRKGSVVVSGLTEVHVRDKSDVYHILQQGAAKRKTAATNLNEFSSRSHSVFSVTVHTKDVTHNNMEEEELVKIGKLNLVDLAGSENIGRSGAVDKRAREAGNINQSLLTLGRCITALVDRAPHIPYRESKLTRLLQDSLGGATKTSIIATVSPGNDNFDETLSTLDYAARAKNIHNRPKVNQKLTKRALIKEYDDEIERLRREVVAMREKNGVYVDPKRYDEMVEQIEELTDLAKHREEEVTKMEDLLSITNAELTSCNAKLNILEHDLHEVSKELAEQHCLTKAHADHGHEAVKFAADLMETTDEVAEDIQEVHNKVDRVKQVHEQNRDTFESFTKEINSEMNSLNNETSSVVEQSQVTIQNTVEDVEILKTKHHKKLDDMQVKMHMFGEFLENMREETMSIMTESFALQKSGRMEYEDMVEHHAAAQEEMWRKFEMTLRFFCTLKESIEKDANEVTKHSNEICSRMENLIHKTETHTSNITSGMNRMIQFQNDQDEKTKLEQQKLKMSLKQISDIAATLIQETNKKEERDIEVKATQKQMSCDIIDETNTYDRDVRQEGEAIVNEEKSNQQKLQQSYDFKNELSKTIEVEQSEHLAGMCSAALELRSRTTKISNKIFEDENNARVEYNEQTEKTRDEAEKLTGECQDLINDTRQEIETHVENIKDMMVALIEDTASVKTMAEEAKDAIADRSGSFLHRKVKDVVPTGVTPARKVYGYSRNIPQAPIEEDVLLNFRERLEEDSQDEDESPLNQEINESEGSISQSSKSDETTVEPDDLNQSITIPDGGGMPFFKRDTHKRGKVHSSLKQPSSRVPLRSVHNIKN